MPAAILPVEKLLPNILALCHCYYFLSNILQNMFRTNSKANHRHISTFTLINSLINCSNIPIYQKINLRFIYFFIHHLQAYDTTSTSVLGIKMWLSWYPQRSSYDSKSFDAHAKVISKRWCITALDTSSGSQWQPSKALVWSIHNHRATLSSLTNNVRILCFPQNSINSSMKLHFELSFLENKKKRWIYET